MNVLDTKFLKGYVAMALHGDQLGWHERNGGNFTYWLNAEEVNSVKENLKKVDEWLPIGTNVSYLADEYFLISGTGKFFHNFKTQTEDCLGIIQVNDSGDKYRICWGFVNGGRPTSELPTHLMNMAIKGQCSNNENRVIYHAHCQNVIAITFVLPISSAIITREIWEMMTECPIIFPEGIGVVDWMVPGGRDIAIITSELMKTYNAVLWAHHGLFCSGKNFDDTFGLMHTIEKSAEMWLMVHACRSKKRQTITVDNFRNLASQFKVELNEDALFDKC